jgi:hypothetical protein
MENGPAWSMTWDADTGSDHPTFEELSLQIPQGKTLVAKVFGEPSPGVREPRVTFLCVDQRGVLVTRTEEGMPLWSSVDPNPSATGGFTRPMPDDPGSECTAMVDGWHLVEWLNSTRYSLHEGQLTGQAEYYGPFLARLDREHGFVRHVDVQIGTPHARRLIEVQAWRLVDDESELLRSVALDLRERLK